MHLLSLETISDPARLAPTRRAIEAFCAACGFDEKAVADVGLVVNEAMANVIRHAYGGKTDRPLKVDAEFEGDQLEIKIRDWGNGKDPSLTPPKQDLLTPGGLGLHCLRSLMDEVVFHPQPDGMLLTLRRKKR
jgi:serine/threonine-protein kinase RsbW